jgi:hypothetical protein
MHSLEEADGFNLLLLLVVLLPPPHRSASFQKNRTLMRDSCRPSAVTGFFFSLQSVMAPAILVLLST